jgi:ethanolamine utilization protein EutQ (cupin superfamily)
MALLHFDTKDVKVNPLVETFSNRVKPPELKELLRKVMTEQGFYDGIALDHPESEHMMAGVGKLDPGAGTPPSERPIPWDEVIYVIEGDMIGISEGKSYTARAGEVFFVSAGTPLAWSSETGCTVLYVTYPHWWKAIEDAFEAGMLG